MPYQLPFGGLSTLLALGIKAGQWVGVVLGGAGTALLAAARRTTR